VATSRARPSERAPGASEPAPPSREETVAGPRRR
jgi:hypothetical protein